jgi:hypothetical protein
VKGMDSAVARLIKNQMPSFEVDSNTPYAEVLALISHSFPSFFEC